MIESSSRGLEEATKGDSLQLCVKVIKKEGAKMPASRDGSCVMRMLCECMHSMGMMENQTELVKTTCDELIKSLKEAVNRTIDEKTNVELKFMNDLVMTDNARRETEDQMKEKLDALREQITEVEEKLDDIESDSDSESDSEIDEEEEEEKQILKKELKERNDEIGNLQAEIDAQKLKIGKLENGEDIIPEDKNSTVPTEEEDVGNEVTEDESTDSS